MNKVDSRKQESPQADVTTKVHPPQVESTPIKWWKDEHDRLRAEWHDNVNTKTILSELAGVKDTELAASILDVSADVLRPFYRYQDALNVVVQSMHSMSPQDVVEGRFCAQATTLYAYAMKFMERCGRSDLVCHMESMANLAIKLMRLHNETIEALSRYRRGGEQKVVVQHSVIAGQAVVNNFQGGGEAQKSAGGTPCPQDAEPKPEPTTINHAASQQWPTAVAAFTEEKAPAPKQQPVKKGHVMQSQSTASTRLKDKPKTAAYAR